MIVKSARVMGFCNGVRRALGIAADAAQRCGGVQSDGLVVHNAQAVAELTRLGVVVSKDLALPLPVLIRAHGVSPEKVRGWRACGMEVIDATCPHVAANQGLAAAAGERGEVVLFAGDPEHAETRAVTGAAGNGYRVVSTVEELGALDVGGAVFLMAQTTFDVGIFRGMSEVALARWPGCGIADSICRATRDRQEAVAELADGVGAVVVVGGRESANTRRLVEIARGRGVGVFWVETAAELLREDFGGIGVVGVTAGASTPDWVTEEAIEKLRQF